MPPPGISKLNLASLPKKEEEQKNEVTIAPPAKPNLGFSLDKMNAVQKVHQ